VNVIQDTTILLHGLVANGAPSILKKRWQGLRGQSYKTFSL